MNDFKTMSDLVADAEDLLAKLSDSRAPEIRRLRADVQASFTELKRIFRQKLKSPDDPGKKIASQPVSYGHRHLASAAAVTCAAAAVAIAYFFFSSRRRTSARA